MMSTDPFTYEREEERDSRRDSPFPEIDRPDPSEYEDPPLTAPDDLYQTDPSEYQDSGLHILRQLECGHLVSASEDSGGMDELDRVTLADVQRLLDFKIKTHRCEPPAVAEHGIRTTITDLDGTTYAQRNHPQTSHDAAVSAQPQAKTDEALCLGWIILAGGFGAIADEISEAVERRDGRIFPPNQVASRLMGLREKGLVVRGVPADTRKTRRNVKARVHYVKGAEPVVDKEAS